MAGTIAPEFQSATRRRELRSAIRNALGVSSDRAPGPEAAMRAAHFAAELVRRATNGRYVLSVYDAVQAKHVDTLDALADCRERGRND